MPTCSCTPTCSLSSHRLQWRGWAMPVASQAGLVLHGMQRYRCSTVAIATIGMSAMPAGCIDHQTRDISFSRTSTFWPSSGQGKNLQKLTVQLKQACNTPRMLSTLRGGLPLFVCCLVASGGWRWGWGLRGWRPRGAWLLTLTEVPAELPGLPSLCTVIKIVVPCNMQCHVTDSHLNSGILPAAVRCLLCPLKLSIYCDVSQAGNLPTRLQIGAAEDSCIQIVILMTYQARAPSHRQTQCLSCQIQSCQIKNR
jgi:hypothetical protein